MAKIIELCYDKTNTYLIEGTKGMLLFDTGWAGTLPAFFRALGEKNINRKEIRYLLISHFHPDHMGIAQEISDLGIPLLLMESQRDFVHVPDLIYQKEKAVSFLPVREEKCRYTTFAESKTLLEEIGIQGEIISTKGHSEDSISLVLKGEAAFVGDLPPLYELFLHEKGEVWKSWELIFSYAPETIYYGHAKAVRISKEFYEENIKWEELPEDFYFRYVMSVRELRKDTDLLKKKSGKEYASVRKMLRWIDKGMSVEKIAKRLSLEREFVEDVCRMYLTHPGISVQGILDRIEIKGK